MVAQADERDAFRWIRWSRKAPLRGVPKNVLRALADHADTDGRCFPSVRTLARESGWCERVVQSALRELKAGGWIEIKEGKRQGSKRQGSNVYRLKLMGACGAP